ncbi:MAG TPA: PPOX class F420-dependent oxidoreductase [Acidimicrobiales bacterium]|nr:PPOX class F420-dependent oxidoreductase [Acidimicrobiales bacterium]
MATNQRSQITMTDAEREAFLNSSRTMTMATNGPSGHPHVVAMWFAVVDGDIWFETKAKSQKVQNLRRDPRITCSIEAGKTYDQLRGVSLEGTAEIVDDPDALWRVGVSVWNRYQGEYSDEVKPLVESMLHNRVAVRVHATRARTWDHRKLGLPEMPIAGSTAGEPT